MEELQKKAERPYKVCFLGYSKLSEVAREVIDSLPDNDVEYVLMDSNLENQDACVEEARQLGCSVFVAAPATPPGSPPTTTTRWWRSPSATSITPSPSARH